MFSSKIWLLFLGLLAVTSFTLAQDYDGDDDGDDFFSGESDDDDFAAASGTPGNSGASGDDQSSGTSYGGSSPMYGSGGIETTGGLGGFGLGASPFSAGALPSLYGAYGAASHPKVKVAPAPPTQKRNPAVTDNNIQAASESLVQRETVKEHRIRRNAPSRSGQIRIRRASGITGPIYTYIKTDYHGNFKWGARHNVGQGFHRR